MDGFDDLLGLDDISFGDPLELELGQPVAPTLPQRTEVMDHEASVEIESNAREVERERIQEEEEERAKQEIMQQNRENDARIQEEEERRAKKEEQEARRRSMELQRDLDVERKKSQEQRKKKQEEEEKARNKEREESARRQEKQRQEIRQKQQEKEASRRRSEKSKQIEKDVQFINRFSQRRTKEIVPSQKAKESLQPSQIIRDQSVRKRKDGEPPQKRRRIPGPAGAIEDSEILPSQMRSQVKQEKKDAAVSLIGSAEDQSKETREIGFFHDFKKGPWLTMLHSADLPPFTTCSQDCLLRFNIASLKRRGVCCRVKSLVVLVKDIQTKDTVCIVSLKDPTGTIKGHIHQLVLDSYPMEITAGAVLVLRKAAVFSPSPFEHIINVTCDNIVRIFDAKLPRPFEYTAILPEQHSASPDIIYTDPTGKGTVFDADSVLSPKPRPSPNSSSRPYPRGSQ